MTEAPAVRYTIYSGSINKAGGNMLRMTTIDESKQRILDALQSLGDGWHNRPSLARALGKKQIDGGSLVILALLVESGQVEEKLEQTTTRTVYRTLYRIVK